MSLQHEAARGLRVLVVEDEAFFRRVVEESLRRLDGGVTVCAAENAGQAADWIQRKDLVFDLALVDLGLPDRDGLDIIRDLRDAHPKTPILVISASIEENRVLSAVRMGAIGYVVKGDAYMSISAAIQQVLEGLHPISPQLAGYFLKLVERDAENQDTEPVIGAHLTQREKELLSHLAKGLSYSQAADAMQVSLGTTQTHVRNLYRKLGVHSGLQALSKAKQQGLI
jgi:DNA-binding NarL/FixJ family response regulator